MSVVEQGYPANLQGRWFRRWGVGWAGVLGCALSGCASLLGIEEAICDPEFDP